MFTFTAPIKHDPRVPSQCNEARTRKGIWRKTITLCETIQLKSIYCMIPCIKNTRKCKLIYSNRKQIGSCLDSRWGVRITKVSKKTLENNEYIMIFIIQIMVVFSQVYILYTCINCILSVCVFYYQIYLKAKKRGI